MKKIIYFLTLGLGMAQTLNAQITLNQSNFAVAGDSLFYAIDTTSGPNNLLSNGGANKTWDFSGAQKHLFSEAVFTPLELSPVDVPSDVTHLLVETFDGEETYTFMNVSAQGVQTLAGSDVGIGGAQELRLNTLKFPLTYNTRTVDSLEIIQIIPASFLGEEVSALADSLRITVKVKVTNLCDAWGILKTPTATYNNTLRLKVTTAVNIKIEGKKNSLGFWIPLPGDLLNIPSNQSDVGFIWLDENSKYFLAEATTETDNPSNLIEFNYQIPRPSSSGLLAAAKNQFEVNAYPNPAKDVLNIGFNATQNGEAHVAIYDVTGRLVLEQNQTLTAGKQQIKVNTTTLQQGLYNMVIQQNGKTAHQKIMIQN